MDPATKRPHGRDDHAGRRAGTGKKASLHTPQKPDFRAQGGHGHERDGDDDAQLSETGAAATSVDR